MSDSSRKELDHYPRMGRSQLELGPWGWVGIWTVALAFAGFFFLIGVDAKLPWLSIAGPSLVLTAVGLGSLSQLRQAARRRAIREAAPDDWWLLDFRWDPAGQDEMRLQRGFAMIGSLCVAIFVACSLAVAVGAYTSRLSPLLGFLCGGVIFLLGLYVVGKLGFKLLHMIGQKLKYRGGRILFESFPFFPGGALKIHLLWDEQIVTNRVVCTLRVIHEELEEVESYRSSTRYERRTYELWSDAQHLFPENLTTILLPNGKTRQALPIVFGIPGRLPGTFLQTNEPIYWELEVAAETPGINYSAHFLLPIYNKSAPENSSGKLRKSTSSRKKSRRKKRRGGRV